MTIVIKVDAEKLTRALERFPRETRRYMSAAAMEAIDREITPTVGLRTYPPLTAANQPPTPYYVRGLGSQRGGKRKPEYNDNKSERLGSRWYTARAAYGATVGNTASYARFVHGDEQARAMAGIGWRKLRDVAEDKLAVITETFSAWLNKLLRDLGLEER